MNMEAHVTTGAAAALTARLVEHTADLTEVTTAVTTVRRTMIGPVHTRQPDQPSPAATAVTGPARTFTGPVQTQNIFQRMMNKRAAAAEEAGADGLPELAAHERERVAKKKKPTDVPRGPSKDRKTAKPAVSVEERVREFPDNSLKEQMGKLYCACCLTVLKVYKYYKLFTTLHRRNTHGI